MKVILGVEGLKVEWKIREIEMKRGGDIGCMRRGKLEEGKGKMQRECMVMRGYGKMVKDVNEVLELIEGGQSEIGLKEVVV